MIKAALFLLMPLMLLAQSFFARVEPDRTELLSSTLSAEVASIDWSQEGKIGSDRALITLKGGVATARLAAARTRVEALKRSVAIRSDQFERNRRLSSISRLELENEEMALLDLKAQLAAAKEQLAVAKEAAEGITLKAPGLLVDKILVQKGQRVNPGEPLARVMDTRQARAVIFVPIEQAATLKEKEIIVDGKESGFTIERIWPVADERHISSYRVELVGPPPKGGFSRLIEIEFIAKERP